MEPIPIARRSASHGSLNRRYAADTGLQPRIGSANPFARPLRSVNENASLLASPGPLESMLKTTTETGDISVFSIRPSRSSATVHAPFRPRPGFEDMNWQRPPRSRRLDAHGFRDHRRRLPSSYRDTASEIISMYGSGSQRSASSSLSHPFDDGQRSYSMTSCSSRPLANKKSNGTLQSQPSGAFVQRPRSPFPYPTRLKRPGVRPSSPAWTENGGVDYSRMIQIDRFSHRTVHGLYKPTYPHYGRRGAPALSRFDNNRSVPSLSSYNTLPGPQYSSEQVSSAPTTWGTRYRGALDSCTSDNSVRSSSLTSIVDMYRPSSCVPPAQDPYFRTETGGAFYYDYSEDFDQAPERVIPSLDTLAPIPTRAPSLRRPMVLEKTYNPLFPDSNHQNLTTVFHAAFPMEINPGQGFSGGQDDLQHPMEYFFDVSTGGGLETSKKASVHPDLLGDTEQLLVDEIQPTADSTHTRSVFAVSSDVPPVSESPNHYTPNNEVQESTPRTRERSLEDGEYENLQASENSPSVGDHENPQKDRRTSSISKLRSSSQPPSIHRSLSLSCPKKESVSSTISGYMRRSKFYSLEPGLSDLASLVQCLDKAAQSSILDNRSSSDTVIVSPREIRETDKIQEPSVHGLYRSGNIQQDGLSRSYGDACADFSGESEAFRGHRRRFAVSNFDSNSSSVTQETSSPRLRDHPTAILSPQPISPARRLRLQNSVPQLMKELPPLPDSTRSESLGCNASCDGVNTSMRFSPPREEDDPLVLSEPTERRKNVKSKTGKLKLKVSRGAMSRTQDTPGSLSLNMITEPSPSWLAESSEDAQGFDENAYSTSSSKIQHEHLSGEYRAVSVTCDEEAARISNATPTGSVIRLETTVTEQSLVSGPASPQRTMNSVSLASVSDMRSSYSEGSGGSGKPQRGLRKRVSDLRIRLAESRMRTAEPKPMARGNLNMTGTTSSTSTSAILEAEENVEQQLSATEVEHTGQAQQKGFRGRMSKWMKTVRQAVMVACTGPKKRG